MYVEIKELVNISMYLNNSFERNVSREWLPAQKQNSSRLCLAVSHAVFRR